MIDQFKKLMAGLKSETEAPIPKYSFVERKFDDEFVQVATRVDSGKYSGVVFSVGNVSFGDETSDKINLNYQFKIEHSPEGVEIGEDFSTVVGDIIMDVIAEDYLSADSSKESSSAE